MTDLKFLKDVQNSGWSILAVTEGACIGRCPTSGCSMKALMTEGKPIPQRVVAYGPSLDMPVGGYDEAREVLKARREELLLTIQELEIVSGIAETHAAKFERAEWTRQPNTETFIEWAAALGYEVVLRPVDLPPITLRMISETRDRAAQRQKRFSLERQRGGRQVLLGSSSLDRTGR